MAPLAQTAQVYAELRGYVLEGNGLHGRAGARGAGHCRACCEEENAQDFRGRQEEDGYR